MIIKSSRRTAIKYWFKRSKMNIRGKTILLTGATRIGKSVAQALAEKGANLAVSYRTSKADADEILAEGTKLGVKVKLFQADLSVSSDVARMVDEVVQEFGEIHGIVHMASNYQRTPWKTLAEEDWDTTLNIIAKSAFLVSKRVADEMLKNKGDVRGKIILFTDWSLNRPYKDYLPYNVAKAAVLELTKSLAVELAPHITVNAIAPGPILKPPDLTEDENKEVLKDTPLQRWGGAEEIAKAVVYLIEADFVTGHELVVDGGRTIW